MSYTNSSAGSAQSGVRYLLKSNKLISTAKGTTAFTAQVDAPAISLEKLAERMVLQGSAYKARDIIAVFDEMTEIIIQYLNEGNAVNLGSICRFRPSIKGTLESASAELSATANPITVAVSAGSKIRNMVSSATTIRISDAETGVTLSSLVDNSTMRGDVITSLGNFVVIGTGLSWDHNADDEGFFLAVNGEETKATLLDEDTSSAALLKNAATWANEGDAISVIFRTRENDVLKQYTYAGAVTTHLAD